MDKSLKKSPKELAEIPKRISVDIPLGIPGEILEKKSTGTITGGTVPIWLTAVWRVWWKRAATYPIRPHALIPGEISGGMSGEIPRRILEKISGAINDGITELPITAYL